MTTTPAALNTVHLDRHPATPPTFAEQLLPGLAAVPLLDSDNRLTGRVIAIHTASGKQVGAEWRPDCRRRNLDHLADIDWTRTAEQLAADPAVDAAQLADNDAAAAKCTAVDHDCGAGHCLGWDEHRDVVPVLGSPAARAQDAWEALDEAMQPVLAQANPGQEPSTPGQDVALIERAAAVIAAAQKQPHTAPYHWAGALFDAGLLARSPAGRAQEPEREEVRWAYRWIGPDGQVYDEMDATDNAIETAEQRAHRIAAKRLTGTVRGEVIRYRVLTMPAEVVATYPPEARP